MPQRDPKDLLTFLAAVVAACILIGVLKFGLIPGIPQGLTLEDKIWWLEGIVFIALLFRFVLAEVKEWTLQIFRKGRASPPNNGNHPHDEVGASLLIRALVASALLILVAYGVARVFPIQSLPLSQ